MIQAVPSSTSERDYSMGEWRRRESFTVSYNMSVRGNPDLSTHLLRSVGGICAAAAAAAVPVVYIGES